MRYYFTAKQVKVGYQKQPLIEKIEISLEKGKILTIIGPNGAGKTTILRSIARQLPLLGGSLYLEQQCMKEMTGAELSQKMAVVLTDRLRSELMTCEDVVSTGRYPYTGRFGVLSAKDWQKVDEAMEMVQVTELRDRDFRKISDGQRQRVLLARAICQEPEIIILDEPTVGLDPKQIIEIRELIRELAKEHTVILSSHILAEIQEVCDYIMIISKGKLVASDTPENLEKLLTNQQTVEILAKGNEDTVRKVIGTIGNVQKASVEYGKEEGTVKASLFPKDGKDIRETVFMAFAQEGCPLLMLYHSRTTSEDVFLELTQGSTPVAAKAMKDGEKKGRMAKRHKKNAQEEAEENELTEMDAEPEENAVPTSEDEKEDLENDSNL